MDRLVISQLQPTGAFDVADGHNCHSVSIHDPADEFWVWVIFAGLDHSTAKAIMNSRSSAFAKRSQSFIDRGVMGRSSGMVEAPIANTASGWGSPSGDELNKLRKSASFGIRSSNNASGFPAQDFDEPDVSWVHSLVKDGPVMAHPVGQVQQQYRHGDMLSPWTEQEHMVA